MDLARAEITVEHESNYDTNFNWCPWNSPPNPKIKTWEAGNWRSEEKSRPSRPQHSSFEDVKKLIRNVF